MTGEILFIAHRMPFPPDRGDKIRSSHVLRHLAALAPVHVATFADDEKDLGAEPELAELAASHCLVRRSKPLLLAGAEALASGQPVSLTAFRSKALEAYVRRVLRERPIRAIYIFSGQMGQYVPDSYAGRVLNDFVDVDSAKFEAYSRRGGGPRRWLDRREARLLAREEVRLALRADTSLFVSQEEADLFVSRLPATRRTQCDVRVLGNGVDVAYYDAAAMPPEPVLAELPAPRLIFTGQMDYAPNVAAAERAIDAILPRVREAFPGASLHIVGRNPPAALLRRHGRDGVHVWGEVRDIRPWLAGADLAVVPLEIARGVQNKVLEAMAMARPVVLSPAAATGIGADHGKHFVIAASDEQFAAEIVSLAENSARARAIGEAARRFAVERKSWEAALTSLAELVGGNSPPCRCAA